MSRRLEQLTPEQEARFGEYVERWTAIGLNTAPAEREKAEEAIRDAYRIAGRKPPEAIVWCGSPFGQALTRAIVVDLLKKRNEAGASVRDSVGASVGASVRDSVRASVWDSVGASVWDSVGASVWDSVWASVGASVGDSVRDSVWASGGDSVWDSVGASVRASVWDSGYGQHDAAWLGFYAFFDEVCKLHPQTKKLAGIRGIAETAGWWLPHEHICWVSERHNICSLDERQRLHSETGPAVQYPDGWAIWAWHGVRVPQRVIEQPETLKWDEIYREENLEVRRVMMDRYGTERFMRDAGGEPVQADDYGRLWRLAGPDPRPGRDDEPLVMVELLNSTPEPDGTSKTYFLRVDPSCVTAREAVASTWRDAQGQRVFRDAREYELALES